ncbi:MAG TPA: beta-glucosidase BglX [Chitinophagaceae bacterium]|nr:beta-glucosidase BglX [Chitinophagaceae bacterium]
MKRFWIFLAILPGLQTINAQTMLPYKNSQLPIEKRIKDLLSRMTLDEKVGQLNQLNGGAFTGPALNDVGQKAKMQMVKEGKVGSMLNVIGVADTRSIQQAAMKSRLGIPLLFAYDVIHGYKTIFPIPLAEACSWDIKQIEQNASVAAREASSAGLHWTFAPMCDISNDPRWGRIMEGAGEDPYYGSFVSAARVKGLQGNLNDADHVLATVKHFAAYGAVEAGREYNQVDVSRVVLWNKYMPPYMSAVKAGAATVMNAFNVFEGVPASGNKYLVGDILRKQWGFKGIVVSDWASFREMITHGFASDEKDAAFKAFIAGSDVDMQSLVTISHLAQLVKENKITLRQLDEAVGRILYYKFKLGLFEDPLRFCNDEKERNNIFTSENRIIARTAARSSVVLLKNNDQSLPLAVTTKMLLVGSLAESKEDMFDFWVAQGKSKDAVSVFEAFKNKFSNLQFAKGYNTDLTTNETLLNEAVSMASNADVVVVNIGISGKMAGEDRSLAQPEIPVSQIQLLKALKNTGKKIIVLVSSGRPLILTPVEPLADAILQCWILGTEHGNAIADVVSGDYNPSGKTVMSFPYAVGQIPVYYNHFSTGRPTETDGMGNWYSRYRDIPNAPLYPFGFGLSYTEFNYSKPKLSSNTISKNEKLIVTTTVTNSGSRSGEEVVQLYIRDHAASIIRPVKELKGFEKVLLKAGESKTVSFTLSAQELSFFDADGKLILEPGKFSVFVGGNSINTQQADFEVK